MTAHLLHFQMKTNNILKKSSSTECGTGVLKGGFFLYRFQSSYLCNHWYKIKRCHTNLIQILFTRSIAERKREEERQRQRQSDAVSIQQVSMRDVDRRRQQKKNDRIKNMQSNQACDQAVTRQNLSSITVLLWRRSPCKDESCFHVHLCLLFILRKSPFKQ